MVAWDEDATRGVAVYQASFYNKAHPALTVDELLRAGE